MLLPLRRPFQKQHHGIGQLLVGVFVCFCTPLVMAQTLTPGHWEGSFEAGQRHFTLAIETSNHAAGWSARIHFPEAGLADFHLPKFDVRNRLAASVRETGATSALVDAGPADDRFDTASNRGGKCGFGLGWKAALTPIVNRCVSATNLHAAQNVANGLQDRRALAE